MATMGTGSNLLSNVTDIRSRMLPKPVPAAPPVRIAPLVNPGVTFEAWAAANAQRIWNLLQRADRRDVTFDDFSRELWESL